MLTQCSATSTIFEQVDGRQVVVGFDGGEITSDAGALLLGRVDDSISSWIGWPGAFKMVEILS